MPRALFHLSLSLLIASAAAGQVLPGAAFPGLDLPATATAVYDDGDGPALYATGMFQSSQGTPLNHIAKWDGTTWSPLRGGIGNPATAFQWRGNALIVHDDGSGEALIVGGKFFQADGLPALNLARWNGTMWSALGDGIAGFVGDLAVYDDGNGPLLYATGSFSSVQVWNGATWQALPGSAEAGALAVFDDGNGAKLYAAMSIEVDGVPSRGIAVWDGTSWQVLQGTGGGPAGVDGTVRALAVYDPGDGTKLYVGGSFPTAGQVTSLNLAAWTGEDWQAVSTAPSPREVSAMTVYDDGNGPQLTVAINDSTTDEAVVASWDGQQWTELDEPGRLSPGFLTSLTALDDGSGEKLYAGGAIRRAGEETTISYLGQWQGQSWSSVGQRGLLGLDGEPLAFTLFDDGAGPALYMGGAFTYAGDHVARAVARYEGDGWTALRDPSGQSLFPIDAPPSFIVSDLLAFDDGGLDGNRLYATGAFLRDGVDPLFSIAAWNGTTWRPLGGGLDRNGMGLCTFDDGAGPALYVVGTFETADGLAVNRIAKWDGRTFSALSGPGGTGLEGGTFATANVCHVFDDGSGPALYVGGFFSAAGGIEVQGLARWHPSTGWSQVDGFDPSTDLVTALEVFDDGSGPALYIAGAFVTFQGNNANSIVKWDGSTFSTVGGATGVGFRYDGMVGRVNDLVAYDAGGGQRLYAVGLFDRAGGRAAEHAASWNGRTWRPLVGGQPVIHEPPSGGSVLPSMSSVFGYDDGEPTLFLGGQLTQIGEVPSAFVGRYRERLSIFSDGFESGDVSRWSVPSR